MQLAFRATVKHAKDSTHVEFVGALNESAQLPDLDVNLPIYLNFKQLTNINSSGIKMWWNWAQSFRPPTQIYLEECPPIFVKSFSFIKGLLTKQMQVNSFYLPFYSEQTAERVDFLLVRGQHFTNGLTIKVPELKDSKGNILEPDVNETTYFAFLKP